MQMQSQSWQSSNRLISDQEVVSIGSDTDDDSNIYILGYFTTTLRASSGESVTSYGGRDYFVVKFDSLSNVIWLKNLGSPLNDFVGGGLDVSEDGSIFITGGFRDEFFYTPTESLTSTGDFDTFILKYDTDGNVVWIKHSGQGVPNQRPTTLFTDTDNLLISGYFTDSIDFDGEVTLKSNNAIDDFYYAKLSQSDGSLIWIKQCSGIDNPSSGRITAIQTEPGSYTLAGLFLDSISVGDDTLVSQSIDVFVMKTDLDGNVTWIRQVSGALDEYTYTLQSDNSGSGDLYLSGFFSSAPLVIDSTDTEQVQKNVHIGGYDIMVLKFSSNGTFQWLLRAGGNSTEKVWDINDQDTVGIITGSFTGSMMWGGIELTAGGGASDVDMFIAYYSESGELLGANSYGGRLNSREEGRRVFEINGATYTVLRSDADLLVLGDSSYVSPGGVFYLVVGSIGCRPVNVDFANPTDLSCYDDSTGSLVIIASGGFGGPYKYSIDNGLSYFANNGLFSNLPALNYKIKVLDVKNCVGNGPSGTIRQPDTIQFSYTVTDPVCPDSLFGAISFGSPTGGSNAGWEFSIDSGATYQPLAMFEDVAASNYHLVVKENNDCQSVVIETAIIAPDSIVFDFDLMTDSIKCFSDTNGELHFKDISGGTGPYEYAIDAATFEADTFFVGLGGGFYSLVVRDGNNCLSRVIDTSIVTPDPIVFDFDMMTDSLSCSGEAGGEFHFKVLSGGTGSFEYAVDGATFGPDTFFIGLGGGDYALVVRDDNNCLSMVIDTSIYEPEELMLALLDSANILGDVDGFIEVQASGGTPPYTYVIQETGAEMESGTSTTFTFSSGEEGVYTVEVNDKNDCGPIAIASIEIAFIPVGGTDQYNFSSARIYPNPTSGKVTLEIPFEKAECTLELLNLSGQVLMNRKVASKAGIVKETLDLSDLSKGMYMIRVDGHTLRSGVVVN